MKHFGWMAASLLSMTAGAQHTPRHIVATEPISIESPRGTAPMLPYRLWVDYNDGKGEYRQVRWDSPTTKLKGHGTGHYLSALALAYASSNPSAQLCEAIRNAEMMVRYVSDGSGTSDMIVKAEQLLDTQLRPVKP